MGKRKDGLERKALLLEAATKVFAEKGFRNATIADICAAADSNTASVNYYFGSKEELYAVVWKGAFRKATDKYPPDMGTTEDSTPEEMLKAFIKSLLSKMLGSGQLGYAGQILLMELTNPTEALECVKDDTLEPMRVRMAKLMRQLLGPAASEQKIAFCAMSIVHQCMGFAFKKGKLPPPLNELDKPDLLESLVDHIFCFSLSGIEAVKKQITQSQAGD